jgi:hypothetical protein
LILTGILHNVLGIATMHDTLHRMWQEGLVASVQINDASYALLWFLVAGFALMLIGTTFWQLANARQLGWPPILGLFLLAATICIVYPKPGPFLLLAIAGALVVAQLISPNTAQGS